MSMPSIEPRRTAMSLALCLLFAQASAPADARTQTDLARAIEAHVGRAVMLDPRIDPPACHTGLSVDWTDRTQTAVLARCERPLWRLVVPTGAGPSAPDRAIRRGDVVTVRRGGDGFEVQAVLRATAAARPGEQLTLRSERSGRPVVGRIGHDGEIVATGR